MWYLTWIGIPICVATWLVGAALCFLISPVLGIVALIFAALLTEGLLSAYRAEQTPVRDRE